MMTFQPRRSASPPCAVRCVQLCLLAILLAATAGCQDCPDGDAEGSLFCHGASADLGCGAGEGVCNNVCTALQSDRDNCGTCGNACGDGLVCSGGQCTELCSSGLADCGGSCVDQSTDEANCGGCGSTDTSAVCDPDQTCTAGVCACAAPQLVCGGTCVDPRASNMYCGASADCMGANDGVMCAANEGCLGGVCTTKLVYRGSLVPDNGVWDYNGVSGLVGANAACAAAFPGTSVCRYDDPNPPYGLVQAAAKGDTINARDTANNPVTSWWVDINVAGDGRCINNAGQLPWTYGTADQGHYGRHVTLTAATGAISVIATGSTTISPCSTPRNVPCCSNFVAP